jgi:hypothetical protein
MLAASLSTGIITCETMQDGILKVDEILRTQKESEKKPVKRNNTGENLRR